MNKISLFVALVGVGVASALLVGLHLGAVTDDATALNFLRANCFMAEGGRIIDCNSYETPCPDPGISPIEGWKEYTEADLGIRFSAPEGYRVAGARDRLVIANFAHGHPITHKDRVTIDRVNLTLREALAFGYLGSWGRCSRVPKSGDYQPMLMAMVSRSDFRKKAFREVFVLTYCELAKDCLTDEPDKHRTIYHVTV